MSNYYRFAQVVLSLPLMEGAYLDFDLGIEHDDSVLFGGACYRFVLFADHTLWHHFMVKKDLQPKYLKRYLLMKDFDFVVRDKNDTHIFIELEAQ